MENGELDFSHVPVLLSCDAPINQTLPPQWFGCPETCFVPESQDKCWILALQSLIFKITSGALATSKAGPFWHLVMGAQFLFAGFLVCDKVLPLWPLPSLSS